MKLMIVSDTLAGGLGVAARAHASWLADNRWDVALAAPADGPPPDPRVTMIELPAVLSMRRAAQVRRARTALRSAWRMCGAPSTVHAHGMRAFALCRLAGLPRPFVTVHGTHPSYDDPRGYDALRRHAFARLPRFARHASSVTPTDVAGWEYTPIASPLLATTDVLPFPAPDSTPTVAWLGLFDERKQPEVFVRAVAKMARSGLEVRGVMGGGGSRFDEVKQLIAELDAPVELRGHVDPLVVLRDAWALGLFSRSEGTPLAVMEAMWVGRSVVASPLPGTQYLVGDTGVLARDVEAAAAALRAVLGDHAEASRRGAAAAARVRGLIAPGAPWPAIAARYRP